MSFQPDADVIRWRSHLASPPHRVWEVLTTDVGREAFWVERSSSDGDRLRLEFSNGLVTDERILESEHPHRFVLTYLGSEVTFTLSDDGSGGTDVLLEDRGADPRHRVEIIAGWLNVLFPLKAVVDHDVDLRNHDTGRSWELGWIDG